MNKIALKITQASLNQTALDWSQNMANHYKAIDIAVEQGSDLVLMPELSITGYEVNDDFQRTDNHRIYQALLSIASYAHAKDPHLIVSVGNPWRLQLRTAFEKASSADPDIVKNALYDRMNLPFNVQTLIGSGRILGMTAKTNLYRSDRGYENRYFNEWSFRDVYEYSALTDIESTYGTINIDLPDGQIIPFGRPLFYMSDTNGNAYIHAQAICEDKWVATKFDSFPNNDSRYEQMNVIPSISRYLGTTDGLLLELANASPPSILKQDKHMHLNELASKYADIVIDTDGLGTSGSTFAQFGHRLIAQSGKTISAGQRMQFAQVATTTSVVEIKSAKPDLKKLTHTNVLRDFKNLSAKPKTELIWNVDSAAAWDNPANDDRWIEERIRNQALWTYDYMRKSGGTAAANASSGGQDSGYNIVIDYLSIVLPMHELGVEQVCDDLNVPYKDSVMNAYNVGGMEAAIEEFMSHYLIMYYMPTNNNSDEHEQGARILSEGGFDSEGNAFKGLGGKFVVRSVQDLVTMTAMVFGVENTSDIKPKRKQKMMLAVSDFVHASPYKYTPEDMQKWAERLQKKYPELEDVTSVALPGQSIAYENFQARLRTVLIWAAANVNRAIPRANPNLTEGYTNNTTAAGDLQGGGFNPNGGIFKDEEQKILRYLQEKGIPGAVEPIKALSVINDNEPSAGLLPMDDGEVVQNDEDTMQGTMPQITAMARLMHHTRIKTSDGEREMNFCEVYEATKNIKAFDGVEDNERFNILANFYKRWYSGQFKIHMATIQPTFGENKDHQTSRRTPNLSGQSKDEIVGLAIDLLFNWAEEEGVQWTDESYQLLRLRAWQDQKFIDEFYNAALNSDANVKNMTFNLRALYEDIQLCGWDSVFEPLHHDHPIAVIS